MKCIGLIGAMEEEIAFVKKEMKHPVEFTKAGMTFIKGELWGRETVAAMSGIGKVNMAVCAQILIDVYEADLLINTGVAGSLNNDINIGDIVISTEAQQHDMDVSALGDPIGTIPRMEESIFKADKKLVEVAKNACEKANPDIRCFLGKVLSGDQFIAGREKKEWLVHNFAGDCAEMEGASMAQVAYLNAVPFVIIRAISDKADNSGQEDYETFAKKAIVHTIQLLRQLYTDL